MIKKTLDSQKTLDYKFKLTHSKNAQKMRYNVNHINIVQIIGNQRQRKREIAATLVFICTGH